MKIFATSDIHGNKNIMQKIEQVLQQYQPDMLLICGDVLVNPRASSFDKYIQKQHRNYQEFKEYVSSLNTQVFYILGNDDFLEGDATDKCYLNSPQGVLVPFDSVSITPFSTYREVTVEQQRVELSQIPVQPDTIVVAHDVPYGCLDQIYSGRSVGSTAILEFIKEKQPSIWLCGHIHEAFGAQRLYNTSVFNCACDPRISKLRGWIIDTEKDYRSNFIRIEV
ncbi:MAG TPA: metallophosphoesterase [Syntrophomonadaceae bacterium]|nr:hypothetical protein [Syntrophomonadaceae bacterium]HOQ09991.1 metallophosphoesterase [Syntrophomonadaceae bacterium]